jgi:hypothetical protein
VLVLLAIREGVLCWHSTAVGVSLETFLILLQLHAVDLELQRYRAQEVTMHVPRWIGGLPAQPAHALHAQASPLNATEEGPAWPTILRPVLSPKERCGTEQSNSGSQGAGLEGLADMSAADLSRLSGPPAAASTAPRARL